jgi:cytochrome c-type biogenesis protein
MEADPTIITALIAGIISFLSPCVLPLVPGYVALLSGTNPGEATDDKNAARTAMMVNSVLFVLGFSTVFIALGASASAIGGFLLTNKLLLGKIAGIIIIVFGVFLLGVIKIPALYSDKRFHGKVNPGRTGSFLLGFAFAFGWTPCIGPILGATLMMAATRDTLAQGIFLLAIYSAGLAIPFLLTAFALDKFMNFYKNFRSYMQWVERGAGVLLIAVGFLIFFNKFTLVSGYLDFMNELVLWLENIVT